MAVVGALLLLAIDWNLGRVHVQHHPLRRVEGFHLGEPRLIVARPVRFSSCVSSSVSNDCKREVSAAPRSQIFSEPISRNVGSCARRSASLTSS